MTLSKISRVVKALAATVALGLGMTACGGGTIGYLWVLGTYYNQISGFLIDDYTGNLTAIEHSPFSSGGTNPVDILVKPGGRFVFVINAGSGATGTPGSTSFSSPGEAISVFSVGGGGTLTFQENYFGQGTQAVWASLDSSGNFLYVVQKYSPDYATTGDGSITAFQIASDTGRLTLIPNTSILKNQVPQTWFDVGPNPVMTKVGSGSCLFTMSPNSIFPYAVNSSSGQLTTVTTGVYQVGNTGGSLTSINTGTSSSFIYLTDGPLNMIYSLQAGGTACSLQPISGSQQTNVLSGNYNPVNSLTSNNGKFLYVLNFNNVANPTSSSSSSISAFTINSQGQLATLADPVDNPYAVGSGPKCIVQDPSSQYIYTSNSVDSTVTGKVLDQNRGYISDLARGSVFQTSMNPSCLVVSGNL
jgi:6-phosphogluconolactonase